MNLPGEEKYWNAGISACAVCDGAAPIFRNKPLAVIGGGDSAAEEASYLTRYASMVYMVVRRDVLRASKVMQERVLKHDKIKVLWNTNPVEAVGNGKLLTALKLHNNKTNQASELPVSGLFYAIGHHPNTDFLMDAKSNQHVVKCDSEGYILHAHPGESTQTSVEGVFACGDVVDKRYRQAVTAAGSGCAAALDCERWLEGQE